MHKIHLLLHLLALTTDTFGLPEDFSERLETAERAHSSRMPLGLMQQQLSQSTT